MQKVPASIFNDVIGPVMRGPSSSHVAGAARIGAIVKDALGEKPVKISVDFDVNGSLAASHDGHGTDMGFICGILGKPITDADVHHYARLAEEAGVEVLFNVLDYGAEHPNNYRMELTGASGRRQLWEGVSVGGGMIEMQRYNGFPLAIAGDYYEVLAEAGASARAMMDEVIAAFAVSPDQIDISEKDGKILYDLKYAAAPDRSCLREKLGAAGAEEPLFIAPVLPVLSYGGCSVPFTKAAQMLKQNDAALRMWELAASYEAARGNISTETVLAKMEEIVGIMEGALNNGLKGTSFEDRILGPQAFLIDKAKDSGSLIPCDLLNCAIRSVTAIMETKSSMGVIVAAPTAGSCGCLPGTLLGVGLALGKTREEITKAMLAAGLIGIFIANSATFAAEVGGCQVECGAGSGMAAAGLVELMGGNAAQCVDAASMALQNITGLACDPVANRVEVPCLGKNVMGASNAIASANMALAGYDKVIPLDETIAAMYQIGLQLPLDLRCTFGGLGKTPTARRIYKEFKAKETH